MNAKRLAILAPMLLAGCSMTPGGDLKGLADDPHSGCGGISYLGTAGGYIGHLGSARPNDSLEVTLTGCKITPVYQAAPPTMLVAPGTQAPSVISLTPPAPSPAPVAPITVGPVPK